MVEFYTRHYAPRNMVLAVDLQEVLEVDFGIHPRAEFRPIMHLSRRRPIPILVVPGVDMAEPNPARERAGLEDRSLGEGAGLVEAAVLDHHAVGPASVLRAAARPFNEVGQYARILIERVQSGRQHLR